MKPIALAAPELAASDPCLVACQKGQPEAIEKLFRMYSTRVQRLIARLIGPTADLEDLVQTTFLEVIRNLPRFRGEAKLSTWICGIAIHVAQHHLRAGRVRRQVPLELVADEHIIPIGVRAGRAEPDHEQAIDRQRLAFRLHALLDRVDPKKRIALLLYVLEDRSVAEIAALMNATQTATRSRMFFARREFRRLIAADPELAELASGLLSRAVGGDE